jgi:hypothetical protein
MEEAELKSLLRGGGKAVCTAAFGVQINDPDHRLRRRKASCLLISYYHPDSLTMEEIRQTASRNVLVA